MLHKVLVIGPAWVGDMVMSQTMFKQLKDKHGDSLILDVFANSWASGILSRMAEVNQMIENPFVHGKLALIKRIQLGLRLRSNHYDEVIVLPNSIKSAIVPFFAGVRRRTGFVGESRYWLLNNIYKLDKVKLPLMIDRFCALANNGQKTNITEWPELKIDKDNQTKLLAKFNLDRCKPLIAFCPAAEFGAAKRWFPEHFAKLADMLDSYQILILGSHKDKLISHTIMELARHKTHIYDLCGKTNLPDAIDLLALTSNVITNDSGLMHIACAVDTNVVALYGSSSPKFTPPLSKRAAIIQIDLECSPCFQRTCRYGHYNCLRFITPDMVLKLMKLE